MGTKRKIWIAGANGQIGTALQDVAPEFEVELICTDKEELDITEIKRVVAFAQKERPDIIMNCAAVTDLEFCEHNAGAAYKVNALGARNLSIAAHEIDAQIVFFSTDDVFNGVRQVPYHEFDETDPMTVYGRSKYAGECFVKEFTHKHFIIRSNWVYGRGKDANFVNRILEAIETKEELQIANDQFGAPTGADELARFVYHLIDSYGYGTYHVTCDGVCSRYEFAKEIVRLTGKMVNVIPVPTRHSEFSEERPRYTVLEDFMMYALGVYEMPKWETALKTYVEKRMQEQKIE